MDWDELDFGDEHWNGQDWEDSRLREYLFYDYWSPHIGVCTLCGFDYRASNSANLSAPTQFSFGSALSPSAFMNSNSKDQEAAEELLRRMNEDMDRLGAFWAYSGNDFEEAYYSPAFFIEWAISKRCHPDWLDWAIKWKLYVPKQKVENTASPDEKVASLPGQSQLAMNATKGEVTAGRPATVVETKAQRQDRRLAACEAARLVMPERTMGRMPDGIGRIAEIEGVKRQSFTADVKAALSRREASLKTGRVVRQN